jgi:hypothetical protein
MIRSPGGRLMTSIPPGNLAVPSVRVALPGHPRKSGPSFFNFGAASRPRRAQGRPDLVRVASPRIGLAVLFP